MGEVLNFSIFKINKSPISYWDGSYESYPKLSIVQNRPPPLFFKKKRSIVVQFTRDKWKKRLDLPMTKIAIIRGDGIGQN